MADSVRCFICSISRENPIAFSCSGLHLIDCLIPESPGSSVFGEGLNKRFVISMAKSPQSVIFTSDKEFWLLNACFSKETDGSKKRSGHCDVKIFVLEGFLHNHGLQAGQVVWVKRVNPVPLQTVLLGISCNEDFLWAQNSLGSIISKELSSGPIVVRENDSISLSRYEHKGDGEMHRSQLHVLRCQPALQGSITTETSTIISKIESPEEFLSVNTETNTSVADVPESFGTYLISDFTCNLPRVEGQNSPCNMDEISQLRACVLDWEEMNSLDMSYDDCSIVFVNVATLINLCLFHGSWVKISTSQSAHRRINMTCSIGEKSGQSEITPEKSLGGQVEMHSRDKRSGTSNEGSKDISSVDTVSKQEDCDYHTVQIFATNLKDESNLIIPVNTDMKDNESVIHAALLGDNRVETGVAYMSPLLYFNVFGRKSFCDITPNTIYISSVCGKTEGSSCNDLNTGSTATTGRTNSLPFAKEVHIAIVHSPRYNVGDSFNGSLALHFKKARLLTVGDIFYVQHSWFEDDENRRSQEQGIQSMPVYFVVTQLVCQGGKVKSCFVDTEHSSLYQRGSVHSYVPSVLEPFLCFGKNSEDFRPSYWKQTTCPGLESYILALENIVKPYLDSRLFYSLAPSAILLTGPPGCGKKTVVMATGRRLSLQMYKVNCYDLISESVAATEARVKKIFQNASSCSPCVLLLQDIEALGKDREGANDEPRIPTVMLDCINNLTQDSDWPIVVIATSSSPNDITAEMFSCFLHEVKLESSTEGERLEMLNALAKMAHVGTDVSVKQLAKRTAGMVLGDFVAMFNYACYAGEKHLLQRCLKDEHHSSKDEHHSSEEGLTDEASNEFWSPQKVEQDLCQMGVSLCWQDFEESLEVLQSTMSDSIGAPRIPSVKWEDVGGLTEVKAEILDTVQLPLQHPELFAAGLRRSGVLLYGPPGTGKTLLAKAVATECSLNFLSVKGPELINMYVGQSEQNVREVFARAQSARPCVIFFDELDSLAPNRGKSGDSGGVMDRVVSQLLAELDGLHKACDVFVIGATNRPDLLDPALLRPGRFDKLLYLGVNKDGQSQVNILKALTRKFNLSSDLRLENVAALCPSNLTGADFYALCSDAMLQAVRREIEQLEAGTEDPATNTEIQVTERDFKTAVDNLVPSVSVQELKRYGDLQKQFTSTSSGPL